MISSETGSYIHVEPKTHISCVLDYSDVIFRHPAVCQQSTSCCTNQILPWDAAQTGEWPVSQWQVDTSLSREGVKRFISSILIDNLIYKLLKNNSDCINVYGSRFDLLPSDLDPLVATAVWKSVFNTKSETNNKFIHSFTKKKLKYNYHLAKLL